MNTQPPSDTTIIEHLALLHLNQMDAGDVAACLRMSADELLELLTERPVLRIQAEALAVEMRSNPDFAVSRSIEGLNSTAAALAARVRREADQLTVGELTQAGNLLEKLVGVAEQRKQAAKADAKAPADRLPLMILDTRPNPVTGEPRMALYCLPPGHPCWVDTALPEFQKPVFDWLETFAPLSPVTGEVLHTHILQLLAEHGTVMDAHGRRLGTDTAEAAA